MATLEVPGRLWEVVSSDLFSLYKKTPLCIADYHSKFPVIKKTEGLPADNLIIAFKFFTEYKLPKKIMSDAGVNFVSERFQGILQKIEYMLWPLKPDAT